MIIKNQIKLYYIFLIFLIDMYVAIINKIKTIFTQYVEFRYDFINYDYSLLLVVIQSSNITRTI